jgi:hypothetical protein
MKQKNTAAASRLTDLPVQRDRADYERAAEALATLAELQTGRVKGIDIDTGVESVRIEEALLSHIQELMAHANFFNRATLMKFYAELRLHGDELMRQQGGTGMRDALDERMRREWEKKT